METEMEIEMDRDMETDTIIIIIFVIAHLEHVVYIQNEETFVLDKKQYVQNKKTELNCDDIISTKSSSSRS